jgi:hypothetical protein
MRFSPKACATTLFLLPTIYSRIFKRAIAVTPCNHVLTPLAFQIKHMLSTKGVKLRTLLQAVNSELRAPLYKQNSNVSRTNSYNKYSGNYGPKVR